MTDRIEGSLFKAGFFRVSLIVGLCTNFAAFRPGTTCIGVSGLGFNKTWFFLTLRRLLSRNLFQRAFTANLE